MATTAVIAGTATATSKAVSGAMSGPSASQQAAAQQQQMAAQQAAAAPAEPAGGGFDEQLVQIQKLATLKDQGLLTEEEFAAKKAQILGL
jgi:hypothetical protein